MEISRRIKIMLRFSFISAALIALFWTAWYLTVGSVPMVQLFGEHLKFSVSPPVSRWWDILIGPIWSVILVCLFTSEKTDQKKLLAITVFASLFAGLLISRLAGSNFDDFDRGLSLALGIIFAAGLTFNLIFELSEDREAFLIFGLAFGLTFGLAFSLTSGLATGLIIAIAATLVLALNSCGSFLIPLCLNVSLASILGSGKFGILDVNGSIAGIGAGMFLGPTIGVILGIVFLIGGEIFLASKLSNKKTWQKSTGWLLAR